MATTAELKAVLKETLENKGVMGQLKARIRAEVFNALDDQSEPKPPLSHENFLINELIREYLEFNKYKYTCSVLIAESGQPQESLNRDFLAQELTVTQDDASRSVPILYAIIEHFTKAGAASSVDHRDTSPAHRTSSHVHQRRQETGNPDEDLSDLNVPEPLVVKGGK